MRSADDIIACSGINGLVCAALLALKGRKTVNHRTPVPGLYHIGAATHPGPGLGGGSGYLLANALA